MSSGAIFLIISAACSRRWPHLYTILLWWPQTSSDALAAATAAARLRPAHRSCSAAATARLYRRDALEQRGGSSRAGWSVECARDTDKALGESQLSRPLTTAAPTPSTHMCAPPLCRHPCTSALTRMLACHMRLCLGRLWDHSKQSPMSLIPSSC